MLIYNNVESKEFNANIYKRSFFAMLLQKQQIHQRFRGYWSFRTHTPVHIIL
jgi:hypothetical protein